MARLQGTDIDTLARELELGAAMLREMRLSEAKGLASSLVRRYPEAADAWMFAAQSARADGDAHAAMEHADRALALEETADRILTKAWMLSEARVRDRIAALAEKAAELAAGDGQTIWRVGKLFYHHNLHAQAIEQFERARQTVGDDPGLLYEIAIARFYSGDFEQAESDLDRMLEVEPQAGAAMYLRAKLRRQTPERNHVRSLFRQLDAGFRRTEDEGAALHALAKELDDLGEHDKAFLALRAGAKMIRSTFRYDVSAVCRELDAICHQFDEAALAKASKGWSEVGAIFIVGMPRSGTTLAERMLIQSGRVAAAGELMDFGTLLSQAVRKITASYPELSPAQAAVEVDHEAIGREYMRGARQMAGGCKTFIDKLPANFMYCGMIQQALPNARIIHVTRNPLDSCYAMYRTLFFGAYEYSYDLGELADYYAAYRRVMRHWHAVLPGRVLDVRYEDLVTEPEATSRRMYSWCGLEWTPAALALPDKKQVFATASSAQVREPIHSRSIDSAAKHAKQLDVLQRRLMNAGVHLPD